MKLKIKNLNKSYETKEIFNDLNFTFESGKIYGLLGRNGAGKTTFFNILNDDIDCESKEFFLSDSNQKIKDLSIRDNLLISAIQRGKNIIYPTGEDEIKLKDSILIIAKNGALRDLNDLVK